MSYFPEIIDLTMRDAFARCQTAFKHEFVDGLVLKNWPADERPCAAMPEEPGFHPFVNGSKPLIEETLVYELPVSHPMTMRPVKLAVFVPTLMVDDMDGSLVVLSSRSYDLCEQSIDTDGMITSQLWAASVMSAKEVIIADVYRASSDGKERTFRPRWMQERWYRQIVNDVQRMANVYRMGHWNMRLDDECAGCNYALLCLAENPREAQHGYKRVQWHPKTRERKDL